MRENICKFLPKFENYNFFNAINLVYEIKASADAPLSISASYRMHVICEGSGTFVNERESIALEKGDVLITPPATPFAIRNSNNLKYVYISFLGVRANILFETYKISPVGAVFKNYSHLIPIWLSALEKQRELANLYCEGIVLCTFAEIGNEKLIKTESNKNHVAASQAKEFIDAHFTEKELSVKTISSALSYNPKYLSTAFKKEFKINIVDYIRTLRIQHACSLMEQGISYVKNVASLSGYDNPLYFSTVFKETMKISPTDYIKSLKHE